MIISKECVLVISLIKVCVTRHTHTCHGQYKGISSPTFSTMLGSLKSLITADGDDDD